MWMRRLAVMVLCASGLWLFYSAQYDSADGLRRAEEIRRQIAVYQKENIRLALEIGEMRTLIRDTKENPHRLEELVRRRLHMIAPGEIFVVPTEKE